MTFLDAPELYITEARFMAQVIRLAKVFSWRVYHTRDSRGSDKGFPDLVLARARHPHPRIVYVELKARRTPVTDDQRDWIDELRACGAEAYIWRPSDWREIEEVLAR